MFTINQEYIYEQTIKKSLFISRIQPITSVEEANNYLKLIRKTHYDATHNCYSYILGEAGDNYKYSDDGEPSQTAGVAIYEVLKKNQMTNVICIITRYFGGVKLGAGGLIRAYASSTSEILKTSNLHEIIAYKNLHLEINYEFSNEVFKTLNDYENLDKSFTNKIFCIYKIPASEIDLIMDKLINITKNNIKMEVY
jgi:uncharacterized YigZ family protein